MKFSDVQLSILKLLKDCRYVSTRQLADLYFADSFSPRTATRRANLATKPYSKQDLSHISSVELVAGELGAVPMFGLLPKQV